MSGSFFVAQSTKCRVDGYSESLAIFIDDAHVECEMRSQNVKARVDSLQKLQISNDGGARWVSGVTLDTPVKWGGGSLIPVSQHTVNWVDEVVIGGIIPTDMSSNRTTAKQMIADITRAFNESASAVNRVGTIFPGNIQLRIEILTVDSGGSGSKNTVTEVVTAFAKKGNTTNTSLRTNVIGVVGPYWSSNAIPAVRVSNPFRLPMISYDAWSSALDSATEFPYFTRVGPANSDVSKVVGLFLRSMGWMSVAVVTDDDAYASDFGKQVANDMKEHGGTVLYHGIFATLPAQAAVNKQGRLHKSGVKNISSHLFRAQKNGARIIFVVAKGDAGKIALYTALDGAGFLGKGYAVFDGDLPDKTFAKLLADGQQRVNGIVHMSVGEAHKCKATTCPHTNCGPDCAANHQTMNQAYDAVRTLAMAIAPSFRDGGSSYLAGSEKSRKKAMDAVRATSLSSKTAASGILEFGPRTSNTRNKWNFEYVILASMRCKRTVSVSHVPLLFF